MASLNKVLLIGNLTRDPELRYTTGGSAICGFGLAINRRFTTSRGEDREETCFVEIDVWGKQAESCNNYLRRGAPALIEGRLNYHQWEDRQTGQRRNRLTVTAERVQFLSSPGNRAEYGGEPGQGTAPPPPQGPPANQAPQAPQAPQAQQGYQAPQAAPAAAPPQAAGPPPPQMPPFEEVGASDDDIPF